MTGYTWPDVAMVAIGWSGAVAVIWVLWGQRR